MINSAEMPKSFIDRLREHPSVLWVLIPLIALNIWYDYYHPGAIVLDIVILLVLFWRFNS
jgi:hypothetical protein